MSLDKYQESIIAMADGPRPTPDNEGLILDLLEDLDYVATNLYSSCPRLIAQMIGPVMRGLSEDGNPGTFERIYREVVQTALLMESELIKNEAVRVAR